jgi:hypothetical protein
VKAKQLYYREWFDESEDCCPRLEKFSSEIRQSKSTQQFLLQKSGSLFSKVTVPSALIAIYCDRAGVYEQRDVADIGSYVRHRHAASRRQGEHAKNRCAPRYGAINSVSLIAKG